MSANDNLSLLENSPTRRAVSLLGIPIDLGKDNEGTDQGAEYLRANGFLEMFQRLNISYRDLGNVPCPSRWHSDLGNPRAKYAKEIAGVAAVTAERVKEELVKENIVVAIGGDHSLSLGTFAGAAAATDGEIGVIYIDAHGDINTDEGSPSGNVHGMMVAAAFGHGHPDLTALFREQKLKPENFLYVGLKDVEQPEIDLIRRENIAVETIVDIAERGLAGAFEKIRALRRRVKSVWVSFDLDSVDIEYAPGTPIQNYGGLTYREIAGLCKFIGKTGALAGMDVVELCPRLDQDGKTAQLAVSMIAHLLGAEYDAYTRYMDHESAKQQNRRAGTAAAIHISS